LGRIQPRQQPGKLGRVGGLKPALVRFQNWRSATYVARYDDLFNGKEEKIDVSQVAVNMNGIELQDREFFAAIREDRPPNSSVASVLPCYQVLHELEQQLDG